MKQIKLLGILTLLICSVNLAFAETTISTFAEQDEDESAAPLFSNNEGTTTIYTEDDCTFSNINVEEDEATIHLYADNDTECDDLFC